MIVGPFPVQSETFITNQLTYLLSKGVHIDIFAASLRNSSEDQSPVNALLKRTTSLRIPEQSGYRIVGAIPRLWRMMRLSPSDLAASFNVVRYGTRVFASELPYVWDSIRSLRKELRYSAIHAQFGTLGPMALYMRDLGLIRGPIVTSFRGADISVKAWGGARRRLGRLLSEGDAFLPVSDHFRRRLLDLGAPEQQIHVVRSGIDTQFFVPATDIRKRNSAAILAVSVGRLVEKKGFEYALRGVAQYRANQAGPNIKYSIVGEGPLKSRLKELAENLGISDCVQFLGWRRSSEVLKLLQHADIFLAPSVTARNGDQEGIPNVVKEAMATGLPVLATHHTGMNEVVVDNVTGKLVPERNAHAISEGLAAICASSHTRSRMGEAGRKLVRDHYDWNVVNAQLLNVYRSLV